MSIMQRLTLIGMINYDPTLFDGLTLPEEYDKNIFIESLLMEHGEKLVLYSDVDFMKYSISAWGRKWSLELSRIAQALFAEYNPIWNYDRYEDINDVNNRTHDIKATRDDDTTSETSGSGSTTAKSEVKNDNTSSDNNETTTENSLESAANKNHTNGANYTVTRENVTDGSTEHQISADNSSTYQPESKDITNIGKQKETTVGTKDNIDENTSTYETGNSNTAGQSNSTEHGESTNITEQSDNSGSSTTSHGEGSSKSSENEDFSSSHNAHVWGNIGVTTATKMVGEVLEQRMNYNLYNVACRLFANELLIGIY